ncbi:MAG TPA: hypothetical protein VEB86_09290, partial [Chryseosolibacter sp.]|nr:hypothetical protein [Chryseosolibacter sp.]
MPTGASALAAVFFLTAAISVYAQEEDIDTVDIRPFERYWTKPRLVPKVGFGVQETGFGEIGVQIHKIYVHPLSLASAGPYFTVDGVFNVDEIIVGPKLGYEVTAGLFGLAADATYYTDFDREVVMLTPKAGFTIFGYANLFYGRNINVSDDRFRSISPNRF